jgi:flagellar basal body-associated protein FliL
MQSKPCASRGSLPALGAALLLVGCYNADALRKQRSEAANVVHMEEVDLGEFSICLPHVLGEAADSIVQFHVFGQVDSRDREKVARALQTRGPELRSRMLMSVRGLTHNDFDEPKLTKLRQSVAEVINGALQEKLVKKVGFYSYSFDVII